MADKERRRRGPYGKRNYDVELEPDTGLQIYVPYIKSARTEFDESTSVSATIDSCHECVDDLHIDLTQVNLTQCKHEETSL